MSRQISIPDGAEPWLVNLIELKNRTGITFKEIAEKKNLAEKSVSNVFFGKSKNPSIHLLSGIINAMGGSWREIFAESDAVIASQDILALQAENAALMDKIAGLNAEIDILRLKLEHKEELLALHNYYIKQKSNG